jgi:hypothetical protein
LEDNKRRKNWQKIKKEGFWEEKRYWRLSDNPPV